MREQEHWPKSFWNCCCSWNHRKLGVGWDFWATSSPISCKIRFTYSRLLRNVSWWGLNLFRGAYLRSLFQCSVTFKVKKSFFVFRWNLLSSCLWLLPLVLSLSATEETGPMIFATTLYLLTFSKTLSSSSLLQYKWPWANEVKVGNFHCSTLICSASHAIIKGYEIDQAWFSSSWIHAEHSKETFLSHA